MTVGLLGPIHDILREHVLLRVGFEAALAFGVAVFPLAFSKRKVDRAVFADWMDGEGVPIFFISFFFIWGIGVILGF
jgi:hypothetical protein